MKEVNEEDLKLIWEKLIENEKIDSPSNEDCKKLYIEKFGHEMPEIDFMAIAKKKKTKTIRRMIPKVAILMLTFLFLSGCMFILRIPIYKLIKEVFLKNTNISINTDESDVYPEVLEEIFEIDYLPVGYNETSRDSDELRSKIIYRNANYEIWLNQKTSIYSKNIDNENTIEHEIMINGNKTSGIYIEKYNEVTFIWVYKGYLFELYSLDPTIKIEDLIKIAESLH